MEGLGSMIGGSGFWERERHPEPMKCHSQFTWTCSPPMEMKVAVILSEAKDLQFRSEVN